MGRRIDKESIERASAFRSNACLQANTVARLWPQGFDVDANPVAAMAAFKQARMMGLDLVFAAVAICHPAELMEFRAFCLNQLRPYATDTPAQVMATARLNSAAYKAALWYQQGVTATKASAVYTLALATQKSARALGGKEQERAVRDAQLDHFERKLARIVAGETAPILGDK